MKKRLLSGLFALLALTLTAADGITRSPEGLIQVENRKFGICFWAQDWKSSASQLARPGIVTFLGESTETSTGIRRDGVYRISDELEFQLGETVRRNSGNDMDLHLELRSASGVASAILAFVTLVPNPEYAANPAIYNGTPIVCKDKNQIECRSSKQDELLIPLKHGMLKITGAFALTVRKNKGWEFTEIRLIFSKSWGKIRHSDLQLHFTYIPYTAQTLDLKGAANMGFRDEFPNDKKGGWTDQGPQNDLKAMRPGTRDMCGIPFAIIDPAANHGKSCLAMKGAHRPYFLEQATIRVPDTAGKYLYILNGVAWAPREGDICGTVRVRYQDGTPETHDLVCGTDTGNFWNPRAMKNGVIGWRDANEESCIGLYITRIPLRQDRKIAEITFLSRDQVWMILAATISNREPSTQPDQTVTIAPGKNWVSLPFELSTEPGSVADLSPLVTREAPAGKFGFVKSVGDHFEFANRPGVPVRFWGVNFGFNTLFMDQKLTCAMLDELCAMGHNAVRIHHFDYKLTYRPEPDGSHNRAAMDKLDFLVAEAKKRGMYVTLDLFTYRDFQNMKRLGNPSQSDYKVLCYFNREARSGLLDFAKQLFGHVNAYTGVAWKDEPAIATLNLINEGTLTTLVARAEPKIKAQVEQKFQQYVRERKLAVTPENRDRYWTEFLADTGKRFFADVRRELRDFGLKIPMSDQNFGEPALDTRNVYDYVDSHFYFCHPVSLSGSHLPPTYFGAQSPIKGYAAGLRDIAHTRILGKPMTVTEWTFCWPNPHFFEGPFLTGAYAALQNYSGMWDFSCAYDQRDGVLDCFNYIGNPVMKLALRAGALLYLRGDVATARHTIAATPAGAKKTGPYPQLLSRFGIVYPPYAADTVLAAAPGEDVRPATAATGRDITDILHAMAQKKPIPVDRMRLNDKIIRSDSGELLLDAGRETFSVVTARSEGLLLPAKGAAAGHFLRVRNGETHAAFFAASADGAPLTASRRIMLLHLTNLTNEGTVFRNADMSILEAFGTPRQLLRRNRAEIELHTEDAAQYRLFACNPNGKRLFEVPLHTAAGVRSFTADNASKQGGIVLYELLRQENPSEKAK